MNLMARMPLMVAAMNATTVGATSRAGVAPDAAMFKTSNISDAMIIGIDMRNENSAAASRLTPVARRVEIVVPERDRPGTTARNWVKPTVIADGILTLPFLRGFINVVAYRTIAVSKNVIGRMRYVKVLSIKSLKSTTKMQVTAVAMMRYKFVLLNGWRTSA